MDHLSETIKNVLRERSFLNLLMKLQGVAVDFPIVMDRLKHVLVANRA